VFRYKEGDTYSVASGRLSCSRSVDHRIKKKKRLPTLLPEDEGRFILQNAVLFKVF
jgi:hypothetical protein